MMETNTMRLKIAGFRVLFGPGTIERMYAQAVHSLNQNGNTVELTYEQPPAAGMPQPSPEWMRFAQEEADVVFFSFPPEFQGLQEVFTTLKESLNKPLVPVTPESISLGSLMPELSQLGIAYHLYGGKENVERFLMWLGELAGKLPPAKTASPSELPWAGVYHPRASQAFTNPGDYLAWYGEDKRFVGLLFPRLFWVEENLAAYDAIIDEFERKGAGVMPVFSDGWFGRVKNDEVIKEFFIRDGRAVIDVLLACGAFFLKTRRQAAALEQESATDVLRDLDVPILTMIHASRQTESVWREDPQGLNLQQTIVSITLPDFDGIIEPILVSTSEETDTGEAALATPLTEQVEYLVDRVLKWVDLRHKPNEQKKIAFVLLNSPCKSVEATVGTAFGLDSLESVTRILRHMQAAGYVVDWIPENGKELADEIMERKALPDFRWTSLAETVNRGGAADMLPLDQYREWFGGLPPDVREKVTKAWGDPDGTRRLSGMQQLSLGLHGGRLVIPGIITGNVFVGVQPKRGCAGESCDGETCKILHDPELPPPHQWLAWHKWLEEVFEADVVVHVGTHGVLELLPGKTTALSRSCFPQISLGTVPHLYIYNPVNSMEAVIAKRGSDTVIADHLPPVLATMRLSGDLADVEDMLEDYQKAVGLKEKARAAVLLSRIEETARSAGLIQLGTAVDPPALHDKLTLLRESQFRDGLHIFGQPPEGEALAETVNTILKLDQPDCPALRRALAESLGQDYEALLQDPAAIISPGGHTCGKMLDELDRLGCRVVTDICELDEPDLETASARAQERLQQYAGLRGFTFDAGNKSLVEVLKRMLRIIPLLRRTTDETLNLLRGFNGLFIEPGASRALAGGKVDVLPTGCDLYTIDPMRIPTPAAWAVGVHLADHLIARYNEEEGHIPQTIGFTLRAMDPYRADGELIAQILYTLGVKPVWAGGRVVSLKPISIEELRRPRIDCIVNLSSILRDGMPRAFELIDKAVKLVAELPEPVELNFIRKHVLDRGIALPEDHDAADAWRLATLRVFSSAPGTYGTGVDLAIASSAWQVNEDLADVYFNWTGFAYGDGVYARHATAELMDNCKRVTVTFEKFDSDEIDLCDCCHIYGVHGGFTMAAGVASGREVKTLFGDTRDPQRPAIRSLREELSRIAHARLLNPAWIEGKKRHAYKGAGDISSRVDHMYGWQATTHQLENRVFDGIAGTFVLDEENRKFFAANNPWALEEIARRLVEAEARGLWKTDANVLEQIKEVYLEIKGWIEERPGDSIQVPGEAHGAMGARIRFGS